MVFVTMSIKGISFELKAPSVWFNEQLYYCFQFDSIRSKVYMDKNNNQNIQPVFRQRIKKKKWTIDKLSKQIQYKKRNTKHSDGKGEKFSHGVCSTTAAAVVVTAKKSILRTQERFWSIKFRHIFAFCHLPRAMSCCVIFWCVVQVWFLIHL